MTSNTKTADESPNVHSSTVPPASGARARRSVPAAAIKYYLFEPRTAAKPLHLAAYAMWRDQWLDTLRELIGVARLHSDEFTRQDEIGALYVDGQCISVTGLRWLDRSTIIGCEDSYFQPWPLEALAAIGNGLIGVSSNTIVHPEWRGCQLTLSEDPASAGTPLPLAILALTQRRFAESRVSSIVGIARNDRAMDRVAAELGGQKLGQILMHGEKSDIISIPCTSPRAEGALIERLWRARIQADFADTSRAER